MIQVARPLQRRRAEAGVVHGAIGAQGEQQLPIRSRPRPAVATAQPVLEQQRKVAVVTGDMRL